MKSHYYVFSPAGQAPRRKHETFDEAVTESRRLCELHPNQTFEVLQCVAITSTPKPQVSTLYMDEVAPKSNEQYVGFPSGMLLPEIPDGYTKAIYRGLGWVKPSIATKYAFTNSNAITWSYASGLSMGTRSLHYCEFIK